MHVDWGAAATIIATVVGSVLVMWWSNKKDMKKRHMENLKRFDDLCSELNDYPPHEHMETSGPLAIEGVRMRRERRT